MTSFQNKTVFITGGTRGIGRSIALALAKQGANIILSAKTKDPHPQLEGTLDSVVQEIEALGAKAIGIKTDVYDEQQIQDAVDKGAQFFEGIDILINNASAIQLTNTQDTPMKKFDLMFSVNVRATFATTQACLPYLKKSDNAHVLMLSPPLSMKAKWFKNHCAYTMSKYGMSMCVLGMAEEFKEYKIAVNALWPKTTIATAAVNMLGGEAMMNASRRPEIVSDAVLSILKRNSEDFTGHFCVDEDILRQEGATDLSIYDVVPGSRLIPDFFLD